MYNNYTKLYSKYITLKYGNNTMSLTMVLHNTNDSSNEDFKCNMFKVICF